MTITGPDARSAAPGQAVVDAAMLVLERMGLTPADLLAASAARPARPSPSTSRSCRPWSATAAAGHTARTGPGSPTSGAAAASTSPPHRRSASPSSTSGPTSCPGGTPAAGAAPPSTAHSIKAQPDHPATAGLAATLPNYDKLLGPPGSDLRGYRIGREGGHQVSGGSISSIIWGRCGVGGCWPRTRRGHRPLNRDCVIAVACTGQSRCRR